ncbi:MULTISPECIES: MlaE family ABC transporter permease [unclassified Haematospirillum]|uniref:MlaE family ABC transporter permease n=1 Tax=unclassified Haematospirillum TaxID=2622088 RepID=UPI0014388563|nr:MULTISPECIES: ABC transporter permease [unclassified Haematospirillum]NKD54856.1 ABC transporter permease [Haematospirillum sp. H4890]NKD74694.1 ABC transporter permease [Haematospirillum sp. H4485]
MNTSPHVDAALDFMALVGRVFLGFVERAGRLSVFTGVVLFHCLTPPFYIRSLVRQMVEIGYYSLPVVGLTTLFSGMVLALQSYTGFARFSAESAVATVVVISMTRELGPVLAGLMVAGRVGASMAAELGTMRVTEQIDALSTLSTNPFRYLVVPRVLAATLMLPLLVLVGDIIGVFGGYMIGTWKLGFNPAIYIQRTWEYMQAMDVISGLVKAGVFGFLISLTGCYNGYHSDRGAQGVGQATRNAVVSASILILIFNYMITELFFTQ